MVSGMAPCFKVGGWGVGQGRASGLGLASLPESGGLMKTNDLTGS